MVRMRHIVRPGPRQCLRQRPASCALAVEPELGSKPLEPPSNASCIVAQLTAANDCCDSELALAGQRLRVNREPRLTLGREDVLGVQVLVEEYLLSLCPWKLLQRLDRGVDQPALEGAAAPLPRSFEIRQPPSSLLGERPKGWASRLPKPRQQTGDDVQRGLGAQSVQRRPRSGALEQQRAPLTVVRQQSDRTVAVPDPQRFRLLLALAIRELDLEDGVAGRDSKRGVGVLERLLELERPLLTALGEQPGQTLEPSAAFRAPLKPFAAGIHRRERIALRRGGDLTGF